MNLDEYADWLENEAKRLRDNRWKIHGGSRNRYDLDHWADALLWAARKARQRVEPESEQLQRLRQQRLSALQARDTWRAAALAARDQHDGMPVHVRMGLTKDNQGPADPPDPAFDHWGCWCVDPTCPGPPEVQG